MLHVDVIILRFRMPKVPRTFKVPLGIVIPIIGIIGDVYMIYGIDSDPEVRKNVFIACGVMFVVLTVYSLFWVKKVMKKPLFEPVPIKDVMAMENERYYKYHKR